MGTTSTTEQTRGAERGSTDAVLEAMVEGGDREKRALSDRSTQAGTEVMQRLESATDKAMEGQQLPRFHYDKNVESHFHTWARKRGLTGKVHHWAITYNNAVVLHDNLNRNLAGIEGLAQAAGVNWRNPASLQPEFASMMYDTIDNSAEVIKGDVVESLSASPEMAGVNEAVALLRGARHELEGARAVVVEYEEGQRRENAEAGLAEIEKDVAATMAPIYMVENLIFAAASVYAGASAALTMPGAGAASPGATIDMTTDGQRATTKALTAQEGLGLTPAAAFEWLVRDQYQEQVVELETEIGEAQRNMDLALKVQVMAQYQAAIANVRAAASKLQGARASLKEQSQVRSEALHSLGNITDRNRVLSGAAQWSPFDETVDEIGEGGIARAQVLMRLAKQVMSGTDTIEALNLALDGSTSGVELWDMVCGDVPVMPTAALKQDEDGNHVSDRTSGLDPNTLRIVEAMQTFDALRAHASDAQFEWQLHKAGWTALLGEWIPGLKGI